jgi:4'-phosphopantetheinyl transferase
MIPPWHFPPNHPPLESGDIHVWAVPVLSTETGLDSPAAILSPDERRQAAVFRLTAPRERFITARAALRVLIGRYLQIAPGSVAISLDPKGKPRLAENTLANEMRFNVAHSDRLALIAFTSRCDVGVDIERVREVRHVEHIARRYFHPAEIATIAALKPSDRHRAFLQIWTGKEAVLKAIGTGITGPLSAFQVPDVHDQESCLNVDVVTHVNPQLVQCSLRRLNPGNDYLAAVAVVGPPRKLRCLVFMP